MSKTKAMNDQDERKGLPSASGIERLAACPASFQREKGLPEINSDDADRGTVIHAAIAAILKQEYVSDDATDADAELAEQCVALWRQWKENFPGKDHVEERLWLRAPAGPATVVREIICSARLDVFAVDRDVAILMDFKTGRNPVEPPQTNLQLRTQAVILAANHQLDEVEVAIGQPLAAQPLRTCKYDRSEIIRATMELLNILAKARDPNAAAQPGLHCEYCRAKTQCQECLGLHLPMFMPPVTLSSLPVSHLVTLLERAVVAEKLCAEIKAVARQRLQTGEEIPGWTLHPGRVTRHVVDATALFDRFQKLKPEDAYERFLACIKVGLGNFKKAVGEVTGLKGKGLDGKTSALLEGLIETKVGEPYLVAAGQTVEEIEK